VNDFKRIVYSVSCVMYLLLGMFGILYSIAEYESIMVLLIHLMVVWGMFFMSAVCFELLKKAHRDGSRYNY